MAYIAPPRAPFIPILRRPFGIDANTTAVETLGSWSLGRLINDGAVATVHEARPITEAADAPWSYVVKRLQKHWEEEPRAVDMLVREAAVLSQVCDSHLAPVVDMHLSQAPYYIVLPRLAGRTLDKMLAGRPLKSATALWIARQIAEALVALHRSGWLHADIKPQNIIVGADGHVTVIDLGFARRSGDSGSVADRWVAGTMNYIAPETIHSRNAWDARSDLYSLGATLYEMLAGRPPFAGRSLAEMAAAHRQSTPRPLEEFDLQIPQQLSELVHQLLAKEPLRRPADAREVVRRLVALEIGTLADPDLN